MLDLVLEFIGIYYDDDSWREARYVDKKVRSSPYEEIKEMYKQSLCYFELVDKLNKIADELESDSDSD